MAFTLSSDTSLAFTPLHVVLPIAAPTSDAARALFDRAVLSPLLLVLPTKENASFDVMKELLNITFKTDGERPVAVLDWNADGWDKLSYMWLHELSVAVKKTPKKMPRSLRAFANLMNKLPEHATGKGMVDTSRRIVLDRTIEQLAPGLREEVQARIRAWSQG